MVLLALCFVALIGIALTSYIAISVRSMTLSNRTAQRALSVQLAELGIEEGLRAFNKNLLSGTNTAATLADWSANNTSVDWTLNTTNKRAAATITFSAGKFGQGVTAAIKVRVDNYDAASLNAQYSSTANYLVGNVVGHTDGRWYRSLSTSSGKTPAVSSSVIAYWTQELSDLSASLMWVAGANYVTGEMAMWNGNWYRSRLAHPATASNRPPNATYWTAISNFSTDADLRYTNEAVLNYYGTWYRYLTSYGWDPVTNGLWSLGWYWTNSTSYSVGDVVWYGNVWYRCIFPNSGRTPSSNPSYWSSASTLATNLAANWNWNSGSSYNVDEVVYYSSRWYRALVANSNQAPSTSSVYWSAYPLLSNAWSASRQYSLNDVVLYGGNWYRSLQNSNVAQNPSTATSAWANATDTSYQWSATSTYSVGDYRSYGGAWYRAAVAGSGRTPNNPSNWIPTWAQSSGASTGTPVVYAEASVTLDDQSVIRTQIRAALAPASMFPNALAASQVVTISSGTMTADSYDSNRGTYASQTAGASAVIAGASTSTTAIVINASNANIKGYLAAPPIAASPFSPRASYATSTALTNASGSVTSADPNASGVDLSRLSRSPNIPRPSIQSVPTYLTLPDPSGWGATGLTIGVPGASTPTYYTYSGNLRLNTAPNHILKIIGPVVLNVDGNVRIDASTSCKIEIADSGSLELHFSGRLRLDANGGGIDNQTYDPKKCAILGTDTSLAHNFSTTQPLHGVIYIPDADLTINASGGAIYGAVSARNVTIAGNLDLHYDTSLRYAELPGLDRIYAPIEWRELNPATEAATMP